MVWGAVAGGVGSLVLGAGGAMLMPQIQKLMGGDSQWKLNNDWGGDDSKRVIKVDGKGNQTFSTLGDEEVKALFGSWQGFQAHTDRQRAELSKAKAEGKIEALYKDEAARKNARFGLDQQIALANIESNRANVELQKLQLLGQQRSGERQDAFAHKQLDYTQQRDLSLTEAAERTRRDNRVMSENDRRRTSYIDELNLVEREHAGAMEAHDRKEARSRIPGSLLMNMGAQILQGGI